MAENIRITVFTPTYNRRNLLPRLYNSLVQQTDKRFKWIIVDDGSTDGTKEYIDYLNNEDQLFSIEYYYKNNGGLYSGYNEAIKHVDTDLCFCCDSDDWLPSDCIEKIYSIWSQNKSENIAGIIGLDFDKNDNIIGKELPNIRVINANYYFIRNKIVGDKKYVVRADLYKKYYPIVAPNNEKNFNPHYIHIQISEEYLWITCNENLCYVEYQNDGMSHNLFSQYINSPNSFIKIRKQYIGLKEATFIFKCRHAIHYDAECIIAHRVHDIFNKQSPSRLLSTLLLPLGLMLYFYIMLKK